MAFRPRQLNLGPWRWFTLGLALVYLFVVVVLPTLALTIAAIVTCLLRARPLQLSLAMAILLFASLSLNGIGQVIDKERGFFGELCTFMTEGPVVVSVLAWAAVAEPAAIQAGVSDPALAMRL